MFSSYFDKPMISNEMASHQQMPQIVVKDKEVFFNELEKLPPRQKYIVLKVLTSLIVNQQVSQKIDQITEKLDQSFSNLDAQFEAAYKKQLNQHAQ